MQREITESGALLDLRGRLRCPGWARQPLLDANLEDASLPALGRFRIKRWDYYGIWTPEIFASATLSDLGYAGLAFFYLVDLQDGRHVEYTRTIPLGRGIYLPRNSVAGDASYDDGELHVQFGAGSNGRRLDVTVPPFDSGRGLRIAIDLACPPHHESLVIATPMAGRHFYYNRKINALPARGAIAWGHRTINAAPDCALGQLDWGRGVWPYRSHWIWASANGFLGDGRVLGLNLGGGFGDLSCATENAIFIDGRLHKLGDARFEFDRSDYRRPWRCSDDAGRLALEFVPRSERVARANFLVVRSEVHQVFGHYRGSVVTDAGETIPVSDLPGFAEEHFARW